MLDPQMRRVASLLFAVLVFSILLPDYAYTATVPKALDRSTALVSIQSVSAVKAPENGSGIPSGPAALFLGQGPVRLVKYSRSGSGVIIDPRGIIVTNAHIVQNAARISVRLFNGQRLEGRVIQEIPGRDIAFVSVKAPFALSYVPMANSDSLLPGSRVYCIGRALNHNGALFGGDVSAVMKEPALRGSRAAFLQVRFGFHLYGGDSGSPILDRNGYLVGLVSAGRRSGDMAALAVASNVIRDAYWNMP